MSTPASRHQVMYVPPRQPTSRGTGGANFPAYQPIPSDVLLPPSMAPTHDEDGLIPLPFQPPPEALPVVPTRSLVPMWLTFAGLLVSGVLAFLLAFPPRGWRHEAPRPRVLPSPATILPPPRCVDPPRPPPAPTKVIGRRTPPRRPAPPLASTNFGPGRVLSFPPPLPRR